jgi:hypothetical protein
MGLAVFFAVAFGLAWAGWILTIYVWKIEDTFSSLRYYWFTAAPSLAGFIVAYAEGGWAGLNHFLARVLDPRFALWPVMLGARPSNGFDTLASRVCGVKKHGEDLS